MLTRIWSALALALCAALLVVQPVLAAAPEPETARGAQHYGLACVDGICRAELNLGLAADALPNKAWLSVMQSALRQLPGGAGIEVEDDLTITLPAGNLSLADAKVVLTLDDAGRIATLRGSAAAPVPTFGLLGDLQVVTPGRVEIGYETGAELAHLHAPLQPDRRYFFVDAAAGLQLLADGVAMRADRGQHATLIMDFAQPLLYVDGQLTLTTDGQLAFIREALGPVAGNGWLPADLPLRQDVTLRMQGQVGRGIEPQLTLAGEYRMESGVVGRWLRIDATPLLARGQAVISAEGLVLEGSARSALQPGEWFDGGAQAQLYVPFDQPDAAALTVGADVAAPVVGVDQAASATVAGESNWLARSGEAAWDGVQQGWQQVAPAMQDGYGWMRDSIGAGWANTQAGWCGLTGLCAAPNANTSEQGVAVAEAK